MTSSKPIHILYLLNAMEGGASQGIYEFVPHLPRDHYRAYALTPPGSPDQLAKLQKIFTEVRVMPLPWWNMRDDAGLLRRIAFSLARVRRGLIPARVVRKVLRAIDDWKIDLVHTGTSLNLQGAIAARRRNLPHIWHIKETVGSFSRVHFPLPDPQLACYFEQQAARVVVMSEYIGGFFRQHQVQNLTVIPDGVDLTPYDHNISQNLRASLNLSPHTLVVGMVAGLASTWKQHDRFIRMAGVLSRQRQDVHFVIVGGMPSPKARFPNDQGRRYLSRMRALAAQEVPAGRLTFIDHIPTPDDVMRSLDILVHPCDIEPFGRVALEAMAAGRPVVGPRQGGIAETVIDGETGLLVDTQDTEALAGAVNRLLDDPALRAKLGEAGVSHVSESYNILVMVERLNALYNEVLKR